MGGPSQFLPMLSSLARAIAATGDPAPLYASISESAVSALGARAARVWINDAGARSLTAAGSFGVPPAIEHSLLDAVRVAHGAGIPGRIAVNRTAEFLEDAGDDPRWVNARYIRALDLHAYAGLPLIADGVVVGVLSILFATQRAFSDTDRLLATAVADYAAIAIRIAQLSEERRRAGALAAVTQLANAAAHELNDPLTVIVGHLGLLERDLGDRPDAARRLAAIRSGAGEIADVVRRMRAIVRVELAREARTGIPPMLDMRRSSAD